MTKKIQSNTFFARGSCFATRTSNSFWTYLTPRVIAVDKKTTAMVIRKMCFEKLPALKISMRWASSPTYKRWISPEINAKSNICFTLSFPYTTICSRRCFKIYVWKLGDYEIENSLAIQNRLCFSSASSHLLSSCRIVKFFMIGISSLEQCLFSVRYSFSFCQKCKFLAPRRG